MALTAKQQLFIKEFLVDKNAARAARACGYSAKSSKQMGTENLSKPSIRAAIDAGIALQVRSAERRALEQNVTKERWLTELARIGFTSIDDIAQIKNGKLKILDTDKRDPSLGHVIKKISQGKFGPTIELHSKQSALDTIGRTMGWVKDVTEVTGKDGGPQVILTIPDNGRSAPKIEKSDDETKT